MQRFRWILTGLLLGGALPLAATDLRINAGGPAYVDCVGNSWVADTYAVNGTSSTTGTQSTFGTVDDALYQSSRYNYSSNLNYYVSGLSNGVYTVRLGWGNFSSSPATITANNVSRSSVSIGYNGGLSRVIQANFYNVSVTGGFLSLTISGSNNNYLNTLEVLQTGATTPTPSPTFTPTPGQELFEGFLPTLSPTPASLVGRVISQLSFNSTVRDITLTASTAYIAGAFTQAGTAVPYAWQMDANGDTLGALPNFNGAVYAAASDGAGGWYLGGAFTEANGVPLKVAHVLPNGSLDPAFTTTSSGNIYSLLLTNNRLYVAGSFSSFNGQSRANLAALDPATGQLDSGFSCGANSFVSQLKRDGNRLLAIGGFSTLSNTARLRVGAVDLASGALDPLFNPGVSAIPSDLEIGPNAYYLAGGFLDVSGAAGTSFLAKLDKVSGLPDPCFQPDLNGAAYSLAYDWERGVLFAGGNFTLTAGAGNAYFAALDPVTGEPVQSASIFDDPVGLVRIVQGRLLISGSFAHVGGYYMNYLARLDRYTLLPDLGFYPNPSNSLSVMAASLDQRRVLLGGNVTLLGSVARQALAAVDRASGGLDPVFHPAVNGSLSHLALGNGHLYVSGPFLDVDGVPRRRLAAIDLATRQVDPNFVADLDADPTDMVVANGRLYIAGPISRVNGQAVSQVASVDASTGALDPAFQCTVGNGSVLALAAGPAGLYLGGSFTQLTGAARSYFGAVDLASGAINAAFNPSNAPNQPVSDISVAADRVYVSGQFFNLGAATRHLVASYYPVSGSADLAFNTPYTNNPMAYSRLGTRQGQLLPLAFYSGSLTISGQVSVALTCIDGLTADNRLPLPNGPNSQVLALANDDGPDLHLGGSFTSVQDQSRGYYAVLRLPDYLAGAATATPSFTVSPTRTSSPTISATATPYAGTPTVTQTKTVTPSFSVSPTVSASFTRSPTASPTRTATPTSTPSPSPTATPSTTPSGLGSLDRQQLVWGDSAVLRWLFVAQSGAVDRLDLLLGPAFSLGSAGADPARAGVAVDTAGNSLALRFTPSLQAGGNPSYQQLSFSVQALAPGSYTWSAFINGNPSYAVPAAAGSSWSVVVVTATLTGTLTASPSATPTATQTATPTASPSSSPTGTGSATPSVTSSATGTATPSATGTASPTGTWSVTESPTISNSPSATQTPSATGTATPSATGSATPSATRSASPTASPTGSATLTPSPSPTGTWSVTESPTISNSPSATPTPSISPTAPASATVTETPQRWLRSGLGHSALGPVPCAVGQPLCLYLDQPVAASRWTLYNSAGERVSEASFAGDQAACLDTRAWAPGLYWALGEIIGLDGSRQPLKQKLVLLP